MKRDKTQFTEYMMLPKRTVKVLIILVCSIICVCVLGLYTDTRQASWTALRSSVTADDTALDGTTSGVTYAFSDKPSAAKEIDFTWNGVDVYFYGTNAANEQCNYKIYVYKANGPALLWCNGVFTLGTAVTGTANEYFADTITVTNVHGNAEVKDGGGNNRVAVLRLGDLRGFKYVYCEIDIPAASQVASALAQCTGY